VASDMFWREEGGGGDEVHRGRQREKQGIEGGRVVRNAEAVARKTKQSRIRPNTR
jgi:hypothetical protein